VSGVPEDPRATYGERLEIRSARARVLARRENRIANARLVLFGVSLVLAWLGFVSRTLPPGLFAIPLALFACLVVLHDRVIRARRRTERSVAFYNRGLARLDESWAGTGEPGARFLDPAHPYAEDLDLFGRGSLFELLCAARTQVGQQVLADWLRNPASPAVVRERQAAVAELSAKLDLREDLAVLGEDVREGTDPRALTAWASAPGRSLGREVALISLALAVLALVAIAAWIFLRVGPLPLVSIVLLQIFLLQRWRRPINSVIASVEKPGGELQLLAQTLRRLEAEPFEAPRLRTLRAALDTDGLPPSTRIARLARHLDRIEWARNAMFAPFALLLMWNPLHAYAIDAWRGRYGGAITRWLDALGELDASCSLGGQAYERPADVFPEIVDGAPVFDADGLGHPLLPEGRCIRNDLRLAAGLRLLIVSGSNMSGKSTLLRSAGVNAVLAFAGATVRARSLRISPLAVGASIRGHDSLQEGTSRFYAEIRRLRQLVDIAEGPVPLFFLVDEILNGTNSHDRRIGAEAVVRGLVERGAIGMITTHDLALARIAETLGERAANIHFEDFIKDGRIAFDYTIRPGVVRKSNALALMRAVGLEVGTLDEAPQGTAPEDRRPAGPDGRPEA
jgi:hypothetical protein